MTSFTSESDSNTFAGEKIQRHIYYFFSLTTDVNRSSQNPRVPAAQSSVTGCIPGVRVHYIFASGCLFKLQIPFRLQLMATLNEGDKRQMWEFIRV